MADIFSENNIALWVILVLLVLAVVVLLRAKSRMHQQLDDLTQCNQQLQQWWVQSPNVLVRVDADGVVLEANRTLAGQTLSRGKKLTNWLPLSDREAWLAILRKVLDKHASGAEMTMEVLSASGPVYCWQLQTAADPQNDDEALVYFHDISDLVRQRQSLEKSRDYADRSNLAKSRFLANMSHEIRTPMTGLLGMVSLMEQTHLDEEQRGFQRVIQSSSEHLLAIINDILDISKIDAGKLSIEAEVFDLPELVQSLLEMVSCRAQEKQLVMQSFVDEKLPSQLIGDPVRIRQVLMNYLNNAIKFTESGHVLLRVVKVRNMVSEVQLRFSVEDSGIGISASKVVALFEEYSFVHGRISVEAGGTGLGLSICRRLAQLMGGHVGVVSTPGVGSNFWFDVTLPVAVTAMENDGAIPLLGEQTLWVCDELQVNRTLLMSIARQLGMVYREFDRVSDLLLALEETQPTILVMAYRTWQEGDDYLRQLLADTPIRLALSSMDVLTTGRDELLAQGVGAHWDWPISQSNLRDLLGRLLQQPARPQLMITRTNRYQGTGIAIAEENTLLKNCRVLLAEDNGVNQKVASQMLIHLGCVVTLANNGREAVEKSASGEFDLILMDCHMPVLDGLAACREIRQREQQQQLPAVLIVALSADVMVDRKEECEAAGMNGYLAKPVRLEDLRRELPMFLALSNNDLGPAAVTPDS
ncbi:ATP-binding protein [Oceanobacter sp. 5_MG-2023]|uniref:ATP-binding protein n=1 Tax=Oceanobacter sp. 5_MG-2023 TaxID=3062645 RepID=UPI0026E3D197|nr:ATP-binding protein [Oceanobacter sp. 5_MG-2023]MDO6682477.1 ATP-binding protein [Oceanobacter sp. 5_MG-2023]